MRIGNFSAILLGLVFLVLAALVGVILFGWTAPIVTLMQDVSTHFIYSAIAGLVFLLLAVLTFTTVRFGQPEQTAVVTSTKLGQLRISQRTIADIVSRSGLGIDGVKELQPMVVPLPEGININVMAVMQPEVVIPHVVENMQAVIKEDVEKYTGLKVAEVKVMVQSVDAAGTVRAK